MLPDCWNLARRPAAPLPKIRLINNMLNLLHLNGHDVHGGAERICAQLITRQRLAGHSSALMAGRKTNAESECVPIPQQPAVKLRAAGDFPDYEIGGSFDLLRHPMIIEADVLHLHNAYGGWLNPWVLPALSHMRPLVWTLHDLQPLSGYCSHSLDCEKWVTGCGQCPDLTLPGPTLKSDITAKLWRDKALISSLSRMQLVACCEWARSRVERSMWSHHPIEVIPNGVDCTLFQPRNRVEARKKLGLPDDAWVLGGVASAGTLSHPWKGGAYLIEALQRLSEKGLNPVFLNVGSQAGSDVPGVVSIPFVSSPEEMSWIYAAMDVFVFPSIAENMPLSTLEAMACGLAVIATDVGGIPEQIQNGREGLLVPSRSAGDLAEAIQTLARDPMLRKTSGDAARGRVVREFDISICSARYTALYEKLAGERQGESFPRDMMEQLIATEQKAMHAQLRIKELQGKRRSESEKRDESRNFLRRQRWLSALVRLRLAPREFRRWWKQQVGE